MGKLLRKLKKGPKKMLYYGGTNKKSSFNAADAYADDEEGLIEELLVDDSNSSSSSDGEESNSLNENDNDNDAEKMKKKLKLKEINSNNGNNDNHNDSNNIRCIVGPIELALRRIVMILGIFVLGTSMERLSSTSYYYTYYVFPLIIKMLQFVIVSWITCLFIHWKAHVHTDHHNKHQQQPHSSKTIRSGNIIRNEEKDEDDEAGQKVTNQPIIDNNNMQKQQQQQQQRDLEGLYLINVDNMQRIYPNNVPIELDNEYFYGSMLFMIRNTINEDNNNQTELQHKISHYFKGKQNLLLGVR